MAKKKTVDKAQTPPTEQPATAWAARVSPITFTSAGPMQLRDLLRRGLLKPSEKLEGKTPLNFLIEGLDAIIPKDVAAALTPQDARYDRKRIPLMARLKVVQDGLKEIAAFAANPMVAVEAGEKPKRAIGITHERVFKIMLSLVELLPKQTFAREDTRVQELLEQVTEDEKNLVPLLVTLTKRMNEAPNLAKYADLPIDRVARLYVEDMPLALPALPPLEGEAASTILATPVEMPLYKQERPENLDMILAGALKNERMAKGSRR